MTNRFSRTGYDWFVGFWAAAPAVAFPSLFLAWHHHIEAARSHILALDPTYSPLTGWMIVMFFAVIAINLTSLVVVLYDVWNRPLPDGQRKLWTALTLIAFPFGGVVCWILNCRSGHA